MFFPLRDELLLPCELLSGRHLFQQELVLLVAVLKFVLGDVRAGELDRYLARQHDVELVTDVAYCLGDTWKEKLI